ncbi:hypothetical protein COT60_00280 [Candidatus Pacearchaeota archaeon CG09_land_8_20_14_0_10_30_9]|nr:hypothetical protein [Candidatus Pacearchaeota archaeon]OIO41376.1 MAG: hypothetical protein AUJ61_00150 [Candidatus Pacearchaeota archaeon CG1_02_30_18]PIN71372.1 MAG: hypothetical protein COV77_02370 [Candidatus Pacearchaeota archaeon CG11_big_fil_rev_8_21_14_0_20_30_13]PIO01476.1 MAG: hypothetical protein COT60_00280 [Candidatus Pacearchaeota archaeon CG09_land_8_20_14_0_10_30_9]PJA71553.1 MAG: hypothetical protein CO153_00925 [Candidatus Pacearchaeota archaeon CG_4_9_14_3_um_filter_30_11
MSKLSEKGSLDFLEKSGFKVVRREFFSTRFGLRNSLKKVGIPCVLKVSGKNLVSKGQSKLAKDFQNYTCFIKDFKRLKKMDGFEGVLVKKIVFGREFSVLVKRNEFLEYSLSISQIQSNEEGLKAISSKSFPITKDKLKKMFNESKFSKDFSKRGRKVLEDFLIELCSKIKENSKIYSVDINSLFVNEKSPIIVNASVLLG